MEVHEVVKRNEAVFSDKYRKFSWQLSDKSKLYNYVYFVLPFVEDENKNYIFSSVPIYKTGRIYQKKLIKSLLVGTGQMDTWVEVKTYHYITSYTLWISKPCKNITYYSFKI